MGAGGGTPGSRGGHEASPGCRKEAAGSPRGGEAGVQAPAEARRCGSHLGLDVFDLLLG